MKSEPWIRRDQIIALSASAAIFVEYWAIERLSRRKSSMKSTCKRSPTGRKGGKVRRILITHHRKIQKNLYEQKTKAKIRLAYYVRIVKIYSQRSFWLERQLLLFNKVLRDQEVVRLQNTVKECLSQKLLKLVRRIIQTNMIKKMILIITIEIHSLREISIIWPQYRKRFRF